MENAQQEAYSYRNVDQLIEWHRYKEALKEAEQILSRSPEDPDAMALIAKVYLMLSEYPKALYWSAEALKREPEHEQAWYVRVLVYYETRNAKEFYAAADEAIRISPYEGMYYFLKGSLLANKAKLKEARNLVHEALALEPETPLYLAFLSYIEALDGRMAESARLDKQAAQIGAESATVLLYLGLAARCRADYKLEETYLRSAVRLKPNSKQYQDEYLECMQHSYRIFRVMLWPFKFLRRLKPWQIAVCWFFAFLLFKPLLVLFILAYLAVHWGTKGFVHVKVFGWRRRPG
ncbi:lipopolysaccharide assembly protein LapB [Cohnella sp. AR92]|uniref:tetratricopeptide repeat protein n=1 Tax=Cohnella sp. AR92 TaxID=648716 RepID=UPI000F8C88C9|nr:tetratricopeptide repeat protein [Cohnella sp. AR92]RUS46860.1 tetratricopeptide repeat protein [Cohnella sp. AR92]